MDHLQAGIRVIVAFWGSVIAIKLTCATPREEVCVTNWPAFSNLFSTTRSKSNEANLDGSGGVL
eukprot:4818474-Amphidinium_carterae.1